MAPVGRAQLFQMHHIWNMGMKYRVLDSICEAQCLKVHYCSSERLGTEVLFLGSNPLRLLHDSLDLFYLKVEPW